MLVVVEGVEEALELHLATNRSIPRDSSATHDDSSGEVGTTPTGRRGNQGGKRCWLRELLLEPSTHFAGLPRRFPTPPPPLLASRRGLRSGQRPKPGARSGSVRAETAGIGGFVAAAAA
ncbi:hypothetical protein Taro_013300 [Colocasia esculenta]|uniref:Uncharacterized protein n=1 Tax=Colocasia esculenta TaxID=4460 RepID=A0A843U676_COLES|nr:hypothetical protein [Colocasia esculenta]